MLRGPQLFLLSCIALLLGEVVSFTPAFQAGVLSGKDILCRRNIHSMRLKRADSSFVAIAMNFQEPFESSKSENTETTSVLASSESVKRLLNSISEVSPEAAARKRAQAAREALRRAQLVGETIPNSWTLGQHYLEGDRTSQFGPGELVVFKQRFAVVQMYDEQGMVVVEAGHGDAPGSRGMRHLGPSVLGKITESGHRALMQ